MNFIPPRVPAEHTRDKANPAWSDTWRALNEKAADTVRTTASIVLDAVLLGAWLIFEHYPTDWVTQSLVHVSASDPAWTAPVIKTLLQVAVIIPLGLYLVRDCVILAIQVYRAIRAEITK